MATDDYIKDEKSQYNISMAAARISTFSLYMLVYIVPKHRTMKKQAKITYLLLEKVIEKKRKYIKAEKERVEAQQSLDLHNQ